MTQWLTAEEVYALTEKKRFGAQCKVLKARGFRFTRAGIDSAGRPLVRRDDIDASGRPAHRPRSGHRWDRIGNVAQITSIARARRA